MGLGQSCLVTLGSDQCSCGLEHQSSRGEFFWNRDDGWHQPISPFFFGEVGGPSKKHGIFCLGRIFVVDLGEDYFFGGLKDLKCKKRVVVVLLIAFFRGVNWMMFIFQWNFQGSFGCQKFRQIDSRGFFFQELLKKKSHCKQGELFGDRLNTQARVEHLMWAMKKPWLVGLHRGLYYPIIWGF